jgi:hypothetical protein
VAAWQIHGILIGKAVGFHFGQDVVHCLGQCLVGFEQTLQGV